MKTQLIKRSGYLVVALSFLAPVLSMVSRVEAGTVGTTTADLLKINQGARPAGMAGAYTAVGDDAYSVNYNPAGLIGVRSPQLILLHSDHLAYIAYEYGVFAFPWKADRALAVNFTYRHTGSIDNPPLPGEPDNPAVSASDFLVAISGAKDFGGKFSVGLTAKYLTSNLAGYKSAAYAGDFGVKFLQLPYNIKAGLSVQNIGSSMDFVKNDLENLKDPLPMFIRGGLGWATKVNRKRDLNIGVEMFKPKDQPLKMALGAEFWLFEKLFAVRAGMKREKISSDPGNLFHTYTIGFSLTRAFEGTDLSLDFAYNPAKYELTTEDTYFVAINARFNTLRVSSPKSSSVAAPATVANPVPQAAPATPLSSAEALAKASEAMTQKDYNAALVNYQAAITLDPQSAAAYQGVGNCYYYLGNKPAAVGAYEKALALDPANTQLAAFLEALKK